MPFRSLAAVAAAALFAVAARAGELDDKIAAAMAGTKTPALAALVIHDGRIVQEGVRGVRRNDRPDAALPGDIWLIGSDGKPMTATLVARLVDRGLLSWDTPLEKMLPALKDTMRPEYRSVTLRQMLSHRAGFPHDHDDDAFFATFQDDRRPLPEQRLAYLARALQDAPVNKPGTAFSYSNTGFLLAAAIAERALGESYEDAMRREVFQPLGMASVQFGLTHDGQIQGHLHGAPAKPSDGNPAMFAPAGNLALSMDDWAAFCIDQLAGARGAGKLLKPATYQLMQTAQAADSGGLGWGVQPSLAGHAGPVLMHAGSDGNWYALVALFPTTGDGVLAAANAGEDMGGNKAATTLMKGLLP